MPMKMLLIITGFLCLVASASATNQVRDPVIWNGQTNYPVIGPDIWSAFPKDKQPEFDQDSTANYKGYRAVWQIQDGSLMLLAVKAKVSGKEVGLVELFPGKGAPISATWFSGTIIIPRGERIGLWKGHARDVYTKETHITLEKGRVVKIEEESFDPRKTPVWKI